MGGAALGAPGEQIQEGEEEVAVPTSDEPDAELDRRLSHSPVGCAPGKHSLPEPASPPPQPEGLREKGLYAALSGLHGGPAPRCALRLASKPFSLNAAPSAYVVTLLVPAGSGGVQPPLMRWTTLTSAPSGTVAVS